MRIETAYLEPLRPRGRAQISLNLHSHDSKNNCNLVSRVLIPFSSGREEGMWSHRTEAAFEQLSQNSFFLGRFAR